MDDAIQSFPTRSDVNLHTLNIDDYQRSLQICIKARLAGYNNAHWIIHGLHGDNTMMENTNIGDIFPSFWFVYTR